jgi:hypothetical protein
MFPALREEIPIPPAAGYTECRTAALSKQSLTCARQEMKSIKTLLLVFIIAVASPAFSADQDLLLKELQQHKARLHSTWSDLLGKDAKDRVQPAPDIVIDYLRKDNELNDYKERPYKAKVDPSFLEDIHAAIDEPPEIAKKHIEEHVVAVFLVQELGTTGYGELLKDFDENRLGFIVLDVDFLRDLYDVCPCCPAK